MSSKLQEEFMDLIQTNEGIIHKVVGLYTDSTEQSKDLYQEILYQSWKSYGNYKGEAKFSTWLYKVSLNCALTQFRKEKKHAYKESVEDVKIAAYANEKPEEYELLYKIVKALNEIDRMIMTLHFEGYKNKEIAEIMGINPNSLNVKIHRLKETIIAQLKKLNHV